jgi:hypothetical protein
MDNINDPHHYHYGKIKLIDLIEDLPFWKGNAIKYIYRAGHKENELEDLKKSIYYIERRINQIKEHTNEPKH